MEGRRSDPAPFFLCRAARPALDRNQRPQIDPLALPHGKARADRRVASLLIAVPPSAGALTAAPAIFEADRVPGEFKRVDLHTRGAADDRRGKTFSAAFVSASVGPGTFRRLRSSRRRHDLATTNVDPSSGLYLPSATATPALPLCWFQ